MEWGKEGGEFDSCAECSAKILKTDANTHSNPPDAMKHRIQQLEEALLYSQKDVDSDGTPGCQIHSDDMTYESKYAEGLDYDKARDALGLHNVARMGMEDGKEFDDVKKAS